MWLLWCWCYYDVGALSHPALFHVILQLDHNVLWSFLSLSWGLFESLALWGGEQTLRPDCLGSGSALALEAVVRIKWAPGVKLGTSHHSQHSSRCFSYLTTSSCSSSRPISFMKSSPLVFSYLWKVIPRVMSHRLTIYYFMIWLYYPVICINLAFNEHMLWPGSFLCLC